MGGKLKPKRTFTRPLGSGRAASLGSADPRSRRDGAARSESIPSGEVLSSLGELADRLSELEQARDMTGDDGTNEIIVEFVGGNAES